MGTASENLYKLFAAHNVCADKVASDADPRDGTVHSAHMENIFVIFDAFAANFGGGFANFVVIPTFSDPRNAMQRSQ